MALAAVMAFSATAQEAPSPETVVATVNGQDITLGHMIIAHETLPERFRQLEPDVLFQGILDQLIQQSALAQTEDGDLPYHVRLSLENEERSLLAAQAIDAMLTDAISEADIVAAYDEQFANADAGEEYNAAHILVATEEEAQAVQAELDAGANFAETAMARSTGPSGPSGGDLGWFTAGMMVPDFEAAVIALEPGQVSGPVQTQFGWHIIQLNEVRPVAAPPLEEVRTDILNNLNRALVDARVMELMATADIQRPDLSDIAPNVLGNLDLVRN
jgi:peptidyl-prolyl cis-trans isomerase C